MRNYTSHINRQVIPGSPIHPIPGRESDMALNEAGVYSFKIDPIQQLTRYLVMGTTENAFYATAEDMTNAFVGTLKSLIAERPHEVAAKIEWASGGVALKSSPSLFALAHLSCGDAVAKAEYSRIFPKVVRTMAHFYEWLVYSRSMRGMGSIVQRAGKEWLTKDARWLAYQMRKYPSRLDWTARDVLRTFRPQAPDGTFNMLYRYFVRGLDQSEWLLREVPPPEEALSQIWWVEWLKRNPTQGVKAVREGRLTHEMVTGLCEMNTDVWDALAEYMPMEALVRNLANLTSHGVFERRLSLERAVSKLTSLDAARKSRLHPMAILLAYRAYIMRSVKDKFDPSRDILNALEIALNNSFTTIEPVGCFFVHALDISGSMGNTVTTQKKDKNGKWRVDDTGIQYYEAETVMALAVARVEREYFIGGFDTRFRRLPITPEMNLNSALGFVRSQTFGGTDAGSAYRFITEHDIKPDIIVLWTDGMSWAGNHTTQELAKLRKKLGRLVKVVYVTLAPYGGSLVDPHDRFSYDIVGYQPDLPAIIQRIAQGVL
jgi:60 kDa SS-A/Ro ribonucleoprotein